MAGNAKLQALLSTVETDYGAIKLLIVAHPIPSVLGGAVVGAALMWVKMKLGI